MATLDIEFNTRYYMARIEGGPWAPLGLLQSDLLGWGLKQVIETATLEVWQGEKSILWIEVRESTGREIDEELHRDAGREAAGHAHNEWARGMK